MKKKISLFLTVMLIFSLISCAKKPEDAAGSQAVRAAVDFSAQYVRTDGYQEIAEFPQVTILRSVEELQSYSSAKQDVYNLSNDDEYLDACKRYDASYFENQIVIFVLLEEPSGSNRHKVTEVSLENKDELIIEIDTIVPENGTDDMAGWHIMIEPEAGVDLESEEAVTVLLDGENVTDPIIPTEYFSGYAGVALDIPEGWEHELIEDNSREQSFGIKFWPAGETEGKIYVSYQIDGFGVCGTGLKTEKITLGAYTGSQGTYDDHPVWDYIYLQNVCGDYVIHNESADIWWEDHGEEAMEILKSLKVGKDGCMSKEDAITIAEKECAMEYHNIYTEFLYTRGAWMITFYNNTTSARQEITVDQSGKIVAFLYTQK